MSCSCTAPINPMKVSFGKLYPRPVADAEFAQSMIVINNNARKICASSNSAGLQLAIITMLSRQNYLRSYPFCKKEKETVAKRIQIWFKTNMNNLKKAKRSSGSSSSSQSKADSCSSMERAFSSPWASIMFDVNGFPIPA